MICNKLLSFKNEEQALIELLAKKGRQCRIKIFNSYFFGGVGMVYLRLLEEIIVEHENSSVIVQWAWLYSTYRWG